MKKIVLGLVILSASALIASSVFAWGGQSCFGKGRPGMESKDRPSKEEMRKDMKKELGLTDEQEKRLDVQREAHRKEGRALHESKKAKMDELRNALARPGTTRAQVEPIVAELKALEAKLVDKQVNGIFTIRQILTPEQFVKLESMREKHMKEWGDKRGPRPEEDPEEERQP